MNNENLIPLTQVLKTIIDNRGKSVPTVDKGFPLIATNCIKESSIYPTFENIRYVEEKTLKSWFRAHLAPNDILFVNKGTPGRVCLVPDPVTFCAAQDMIGLRVDNSKINYKYLFAFLRSNWVKRKIENYHVGLVIPHFKKQDLDNILIPQKREKEQEFIGDLYLTLSKKIELNNRINAELEAMTKTMYDYWFVQFDFPTEQGKPYKSSGGKMVYNKEMKREIPEGWEVKKLEETTSFISRGISPKYVDNDGVCVLNQKCIRNRTVLYKEARRNDNNKNNAESKRVLKYDVLVNSTGVGTLGRVAVVNRLPEDFITVDSHVTIVRANEKVINKFFFGFFLIEKQNEIERFAYGSTGQVELSRSQLGSLKIIVPSNEVQKKFEKIYKNCLDKMAINSEQNQHLASLRDWLLPMLMNGQVTVKEAEGRVGKTIGNFEDSRNIVAEPMQNKYTR